MTVSQMGKLAIAFVLMSLGINAADGASTQFQIQEIGTFSSYSTPNVGQGYAGTGFIGYINPSASPTGFARVLGLEADYTRTGLQVDISSLRGTAIDKATLTFNLGTADIAPSSSLTATSFVSDGTLRYKYEVSNALNAVTTALAGSAVSIDVTPLLRERVSGNSNWLGIHLASTDASAWTTTYPGHGGNRDAASMRLSVDYSVPEPGVAVLICGSTIALALVRRRRVCVMPTKVAQATSMSMPGYT